MFVKPAKGRAVRWPRTMRLLKESGETVPENQFWLLALHHGDVVNADPTSSPVAQISGGDASLSSEKAA